MIYNTIILIMILLVIFIEYKTYENIENYKIKNDLILNNNEQKNNIEEVLNLSYEGTTCFIPVECKSITKRKQMLAFSKALKKETEPTRNLEDMSNIIEMINKHI